MSPNAGGRACPCVQPSLDARNLASAALCERLGCRFADPFEALRDGDTGFAKPGAMRDGLHLSAYRPVMRALEPALCPTLPPSRPAAGP